MKEMSDINQNSVCDRTVSLRSACAELGRLERYIRKHMFSFTKNFAQTAKKALGSSFFPRKNIEKISDHNQNLVR